MPKVRAVLAPQPTKTTTTAPAKKTAQDDTDDTDETDTPRIERLEVRDAPRGVSEEIGSIVTEGGTRPVRAAVRDARSLVPRANDADFVDDADVPPLM